MHRETRDAILHRIMRPSAWDDGLAPDTARLARGAARRRLAEGRRALRPDSRRLLQKVCLMYDGFWALPEFAADLARWKAANRRGKPPPGDSDKLILATAADIASRGPACLFTADIDFVAFTDPIRDILGVDVIGRWDTSRWPRWSGGATPGP